MTTTQPAVDTFGWDTVFAVPFSIENDAIRTRKSTPQGFSFTHKPDGATIAGRWGDWQLVPGGGGQVIQMRCPIVSGTVSGPADSQRLDGHTMDIQVKLEVIRDPVRHVDDKTSSGGETCSLVIRKKGSRDNPPVKLVGMDFDMKSAYWKANLQKYMSTWFNENISLFSHVFALVLLNAKADRSSFQWVKPTHVSYAVANSAGAASTGVLGVLCMTEGRTVSKRTPKIDIRILETISAGANSAFAISPERAMEHVLIPDGSRFVAKEMKKADPLTWLKVPEPADPVDFGTFADNCVTTTVWPAAKKWEPSSVSIHDALVISGKFI